MSGQVSRYMGVYFHQMTGQNHINHKTFKNMGTVFGFEKRVTTQNQIFIYIYKQS
jgi:hypothetical protein